MIITTTTLLARRTDTVVMRTSGVMLVPRGEEDCLDFFPISGARVRHSPYRQTDALLHGVLMVATSYWDRRTESGIQISPAHTQKGVIVSCTFHTVLRLRLPNHRLPCQTWDHRERIQDPIGIR